MQTIENNNDLKMSKSVEDIFIDKKCEAEAAATKVHTEVELILQEYSEENNKHAPDTSVVKQYAAGDVETAGVSANRPEKFYSIYHRECPLAISSNMNGLVGGSTFWYSGPGIGGGLYELSHPEIQDPALLPVFFPAKYPKVRRKPDNRPAPISLMAQYLHDQIAESTKLKAAITSGNCGRDFTPLNHQTGIKDACYSQEAVLEKQKRVRSRVFGCLRRVCCCVGQKEE